MNGITITLNDKTKGAVCRETVALCAQYSVKVEPALEGDGFLVMHRRHVGSGAPDGRTVFIGGEVVASPVYDWDMNEVYAVVNLTTTTTDGVSETTGTLDLRYQNICKDFIQKYGAGANAPLNYAVYDTSGGGMVGEGEFDVKVVEPYYITEDQNLAMFKGDTGASVESVTLVGVDAAGNYVYAFSYSDGSTFNVTCPHGPAGMSSDGACAFNETTGKYHKLKVTVNSLGQLTVKVDPTPYDEPPSGANYVSLSGTETVTGAKTFIAALTASGGIVGNLTGDVTGDVTGNVTGDVTGNVTGDLTGSVDATGDGKQVLVPTQATTDSSTKAASTEFVHNAIEDSAGELFEIAYFPDDKTSGGKWAAMRRTASLQTVRYFTKTDYPEAYADLLRRMNEFKRVTTNYAIGTSSVVAFQNDDLPTIDRSSLPTNVAMTSGGIIAMQYSNINFNSDDYSTWSIRIPFKKSSTGYEGVITAYEYWHNKGESYNDSGYVRYYTADTMYAADEYDDGVLPRYKTITVELSNTNYRVYAGNNGTSFNLINGTTNSIGKTLSVNTWYILEIGVDATGFYMRVYDHSSSSDAVRPFTAAPLVNTEYMALGNSVVTGYDSARCAYIGLDGMVFTGDGTTVFNWGTNGVYSTTNYFFSSVNGRMGFRVLANSKHPQSTGQYFTINTNLEEFALPLAAKEYDDVTNFDSLPHLRLKL